VRETYRACTGSATEQRAKKRKQQSDDDRRSAGAGQCTRINDGIRCARASGHNGPCSRPGILEQKRFTCDFPGCAYAAKQKAHLDKHMKSHNDARAGVRLVIGGAQPTVELAATIKKPAWNRRRGEV
jgi:hypothetical protein